MFSKTLTLSGRLPGATAEPNQRRDMWNPWLRCAAGHLAQVVGGGAELDLLDLVEGEADALELAAERVGALGVVDVDDGALGQVHVRVHERGVLAFEHFGNVALEVFLADTGRVMDGEITRHGPPPSSPHRNTRSGAPTVANGRTRRPQPTSEPRRARSRYGLPGLATKSGRAIGFPSLTQPWLKSSDTCSGVFPITYSTHNGWLPPGITIDGLA